MSLPGGPERRGSSRRPRPVRHAAARPRAGSRRRAPGHSRHPCSPRLLARGGGLWSMVRPGLATAHLSVRRTVRKAADLVPESGGYWGPETMVCSCPPIAPGISVPLDVKPLTGARIEAKPSPCPSRRLYRYLQYMLWPAAMCNDFRAHRLFSTRSAWPIPLSACPSDANIEHRLQSGTSRLTGPRHRPSTPAVTSSPSTLTNTQM
jgi:hypothetical protein